MMAEHVRNLKPSAKSGKRFLAVVRNRKCNRNHLRRCLLPAGLLDIRAGSPQNPSSSKHTRQPPVPRTLTSRLLPFTLSLDRWLARLYSAVRVALEVHKRFGPSENEPPTVHVFVHVIKLGTVHPDSKRQALARRLLALGLALLWVREPWGGLGHCHYHPPRGVGETAGEPGFARVRNQRTPRSRDGTVDFERAQVSSMSRWAGLKRFRTRIPAEVFSPANGNTFQSSPSSFFVLGLRGVGSCSGLLTWGI
jgi:hypothetical protein